MSEVSRGRELERHGYLTMLRSKKELHARDLLKALSLLFMGMIPEVMMILHDVWVMISDARIMLLPGST
eukprot:1150605-Pelagomonas_calceolata.AAC.4